MFFCHICTFFTFLLFILIAHIYIYTTKTILINNPTLILEAKRFNVKINADIRGVAKLWRGYSAPCGEVTKSVTRLPVARLPVIFATKDYNYDVIFNQK